MNRRKRKPQKLFTWLMRKIVPEYDALFLSGDFEEVYETIAQENGVLRASVWYMGQIFKSMPHFFTNSITWSMSMFKNYVKIGLRNIKRNKVTSFINSAGLSIGIACCILVFFFVKNEYSYDSFHQNADEIFLAALELDIETGKMLNAGTPIPLASTYLNDYAEIIDAVQISMNESDVKYGDLVFKENIHFTDNSFFRMFTVPLIFGNVRTALNQPDEIVISREISEKYFGDNNPINEYLSINIKGESHRFRVSGVLEKLPENSIIRVNFLINSENLKYVHKEDYNTAWQFFPSTVNFLQFKKGTDVRSLTAKLPNIKEKYGFKTNIVIQGSGRASGSVTGNVKFVNIKDVHLDNDLSPSWHLVYQKGKRQYSYILSGIALLILVMACINFTNLSIGQSLKRAKEVGMRKVFGAKKKQLIKQFLSETILLTLFSLILGILLAELLLPVFNQLAGQNLDIQYFSNSLALLFLLLLLVTVGMLAGMYPAFILSGFQPMRVLRGRQKLSRGHLFSQSLIVVQFSLSAVLFISAAIMYGQLNHLKYKDLGFNREQVVTLEVSSPKSREIFKEMKDTLLGFDNIISLSASTGSIYRTGIYVYQKKNDVHVLPSLWVDYDFLETLKIDVVKGRNFSKEISTDLTRSIIINESFMKEYGMNDPIGKELTFDDEGKEGKIITGVVKDFHFKSFSDKIEPLVIYLHPEKWNISLITVRFRAGELKPTLDLLKDTWQKVAPDEPFMFSFLDEEVQAQYRSDEKWGRIVGYSTLLAIIVACLGLYGITSLTVSQRTKEFGIRKVLGSSVVGVLNIVNREFMRLIITANIIAWPTAYFIMGKWLQGFAYRIPIRIDEFLISSLLVLLIAIITVTLQAMKAGLTNPIKSLRYE